MPSLEFYRQKEKGLKFIHELMAMLKKYAVGFSENNLRPQAGFYPSFRIGWREYNIVNTNIDGNECVIIQPKYFYHSDGSYSVSPPPKKTFYHIQNAFEYLTS